MKSQFDLPIYLYVCRYKRSSGTRFGSDLCLGRFLTAQEERDAKFWVHRYIHYWMVAYAPYPSTRVGDLKNAFDEFQD